MLQAILMFQATLEAVIRTSRLVKIPTPIIFMTSGNPNYIATGYLDSGIVKIYPDMAYSNYYNGIVSSVFVILPFEDYSREELNHLTSQVVSSMRVISKAPIG